MFLPLNIFTPEQAAILLGVAALLGAVFGSFVNCLAWRFVNGESVLAGRSHCTSCGHVLGVIDLIPVVSWLALRGRCRHCGAKVSPRYVLVELALAVVFALLLWQYGVGVPWLAYGAFATILVGAALVDLDTYTIPNGFILAALAVWLTAFVAFPALATSANAGCCPPVSDGARAAAQTLAAAPISAFATPISAAGEPAPFSMGAMFVPLVGEGWQAVALDGLAGALCVGGGILLFSLLFDAVTKRTSLGGGDVKLLFAVGLFLGLPLSLLNLLIACILGLAFALIRPSHPQPQAPVPRGIAADPASPHGIAAAPASRDVVADPASPRDIAAAAAAPRDVADALPARAIPFGPAIAAATIVTLLIGPALLTWYISLF